MKKHRFYFVYCSICIKFENEKVQDCTNTGYFFDGKAKKWRKYLVKMKKGCTFALREPAKPLYDAQMCGSFFITPSQTFFLCIYLVISKEM